MELESKNSDFLGGVFFRAKHSVIAKANITAKQSEITQDNFYIFYVQVGGNYETYTLL